MSDLHYLSPALRSVKSTTDWWSDRLQSDTRLVRWGHFGIPLLLFPTAGGDAEEVERFFLIKALEAQIVAGHIKVYSVHSLAGRAWLTNDDVAHCVWMQKQFDAYLQHEVVPAIRHDCQSDTIGIMAAGASIGAFSALLTLCRQPETFTHAICMSGTYDLQRWMKGVWLDEFHHYSPLNFVPGLEENSPQLQQLRQRWVVLASGQGKNEDTGQSWRVADVLGERSVPNRVDIWGPEWEHDWVTWRAMLPWYIDEILSNL